MQEARLYIFLGGYSREVVRVCRNPHLRDAFLCFSADSHSGTASEAARQCSVREKQRESEWPFPEPGELQNRLPWGDRMSAGVDGKSV